MPTDGVFVKSIYFSISMHVYKNEEVRFVYFHNNAHMSCYTKATATHNISADMKVEYIYLLKRRHLSNKIANLNRTETSIRSVHLISHPSCFST